MELLATWLPCGIAPVSSESALQVVSLSFATSPRELREGDFMIGCGPSHGLREVYRIQETSFEESYAPLEASSLLCVQVC